MSDRCAFIEAEKATTPISFQCARLGVSTSTFYAWRHRQANPTPKMRADAELTATIVTIHTQSHGVYGSPRVHAELTLGLGRAGQREAGRAADAPGRHPGHLPPAPARLHPPPGRCGAV